jgi:hypothetical protein
MTRRCFEIAWRVTLQPDVSRVMDIGPCPLRRATRRNLVSSPNAAKSDARTFGRAIAMFLRILRKIFLDEPYHQRPAAFVCAEGFCTARKRDLVKARFGNSELHAIRRFL